MSETGENVELKPIEKTCVDCPKTFIWGTKDQEYYKKNNFAPPKRCKDCARKRRLAHQEREQTEGKVDRNIEKRGYKSMNDAEMLGERNGGV